MVTVNRVSLAQPAFGNIVSTARVLGLAAMLALPTVATTTRDTFAQSSDGIPQSLGSPRDLNAWAAQQLAGRPTPLSLNELNGLITRHDESSRLLMLQMAWQTSDTVKQLAARLNAVDAQLPQAKLFTQLDRVFSVYREVLQSDGLTPEIMAKATYRPASAETHVAMLRLVRETLGTSLHDMLSSGLPMNRYRVPLHPERLLTFSLEEASGLGLSERELRRIPLTTFISDYWERTAQTYPALANHAELKELVGAYTTTFARAEGLLRQHVSASRETAGIRDNLVAYLEGAAEAVPSFPRLGPTKAGEPFAEYFALSDVETLRVYNNYGHTLLPELAKRLNAINRLYEGMKSGYGWDSNRRMLRFSDEALKEIAEAQGVVKQTFDAVIHDMENPPRGETAHGLALKAYGHFCQTQTVSLMSKGDKYLGDAFVEMQTDTLDKLRRMEALTVLLKADRDLKGRLTPEGLAQAKTQLAQVAEKSYVACRGEIDFIAEPPLAFAEVPHPLQGFGR